MRPHPIFACLAPIERLLKPLQTRVLGALGPALYPQGRELDAWAAATDAFIEKIDPAQRIALRFSIIFLELSPLLLQVGPDGSHLGVRRFSKLPEADRRRVLRCLDEHYNPAPRNLWKLLRVIAHFIYFGERQRAAAYGFDPHERRRRADVFRQGQERHPTRRRRSHPPHERPRSAEAEASS